MNKINSIKNKNKNLKYIHDTKNKKNHSYHSLKGRFKAGYHNRFERVEEFVPKFDGNISSNFQNYSIDELIDEEDMLNGIGGSKVNKVMESSFKNKNLISNAFEPVIDIGVKESVKEGLKLIVEKGLMSLGYNLKNEDIILFKETKELKNIDNINTYKLSDKDRISSQKLSKLNNFYTKDEDIKELDCDKDLLYLKESKNLDNNINTKGNNSNYDINKEIEFYEDEDYIITNSTYGVYDKILSKYNKDKLKDNNLLDTNKSKTLLTNFSVDYDLSNIHCINNFNKQPNNYNEIINFISEFK